jgi:cytochrome c oxidase assembly protein subunit 15
LLALLAMQVFSGLSNVLLDWPLLAALLHTAGAAALVAVLTSLATRRHARGAAAHAAAEAAWRHHRA